MKRFIMAVAALACVTSSGVAWAQGQKMRPGLWEHNYRTQSQSGQMEQSMKEMQQAMANMSPEERKMMQEMMARQGRGAMGSAGGHPGGSVRMCITKAQAERDELPQEGNCKQQLVQRSGNTMKVKFNCTGDPPSSGETEVTFSGPMAYTGRSIVNMMIDGKPDRMTMEQSGKWLSDDCGNVKPRRN